MTELYDQILAAGPLDWLALLTSLAYVWLAARDNRGGNLALAQVQGGVD